DGHSPLSAYERKRLKNITENAKFFAALQLHEVCLGSEQHQNVLSNRAKPKKAEEEPVRRRSMRLQRVEPSELALPEVSTQPIAEENDRWPQVPAGPLPMLPEDQMGDSKLTEDLLAVWMSISEVIVVTKVLVVLCRYQDSLNSMVLSEENIRKVVKTRVCSMAIHPSESILFLAAGDKNGQIGLWNVDCRSEEAAHSFTPHDDAVNCMYFSPCNPAHLLSLSSQSLRCGDVTRALFDEIYRGEEMSSFDFLEGGDSTAVVGQWNGDVLVVDRRTPGTSAELSADIGFTRTRTVHVHPVHKQYFVAAGSKDVAVYDVRYLKTSKNKPVSSLQGHTKSVASAYFSPLTGHKVVTVCADDKLRHRNNTGRWLTRFRAIWEPKQEEFFVVGSLVQPRQIEVFQDTGKLVHAFCNPDCLASVCSINVLHPSRNILVGGNSSGRLHVFREETTG
ncbi:WDR76 protein, partial [Psilopogon haemacephalus]|nr:WDR76 protein [Psilopogon haemacephalus]